MGSKEISLKKLEKLSAIIDISTDSFSNILSILFENNFERFFKAFQVYHQWNHKYQAVQRKIKKVIDHQIEKRLLRIAKKMKKSNEVLFGVVNSNTLLIELIKLDPQLENMPN
jgi:hypothetical protein